MSDAYELFQKGSKLLEEGHFNQAAIPLAKARDLEPDKTSIREALGRAYFRSHQFERARAELGGRGARADERLRPVLPRARADAARPRRRGAPAARAGRIVAARPAGLPHLP